MLLEDDNVLGAPFNVKSSLWSLLSRILGFVCLEIYSALGITKELQLENSSQGKKYGGDDERKKGYYNTFTFLFQYIFFFIFVALHVVLFVLMYVITSAVTFLWKTIKTIKKILFKFFPALREFRRPNLLGVLSTDNPLLVDSEFCKPFVSPLQFPFTTTDGLTRFHALCTRYFPPSKPQILGLKSISSENLFADDENEISLSDAAPSMLEASIKALNVEWLHMQNPCTEFEEDERGTDDSVASTNTNVVLFLGGKLWNGMRGKDEQQRVKQKGKKNRLPAQRCPGLGVGEGVMYMLYQMGKEMGMDCLMNIPEVFFVFGCYVIFYYCCLAFSQCIFV
jgi:hypothetical protein